MTACGPGGVWGFGGAGAPVREGWEAPPARGVGLGCSAGAVRAPELRAAGPAGGAHLVGRVAAADHRQAALCQVAEQVGIHRVLARLLDCGRVWVAVAGLRGSQGEGGVGAGRGARSSRPPQRPPPALAPPPRRLTLVVQQLDGVEHRREHIAARILELLLSGWGRGQGGRGREGRGVGWGWLGFSRGRARMRPARTGAAPPMARHQLRAGRRRGGAADAVPCHRSRRMHPERVRPRCAVRRARTDRGDEQVTVLLAQDAAVCGLGVCGVQGGGASAVGAAAWRAQGDGRGGAAARRAQRGARRTRGARAAPPRPPRAPYGRAAPPRAHLVRLRGVRAAQRAPAPHGEGAQQWRRSRRRGRSQRVPGAATSAGRAPGRRARAAGPLLARAMNRGLAAFPGALGAGCSGIGYCPRPRAGGRAGKGPDRRAGASGVLVLVAP
jgi:hypothetical protein